MPNSQLIVHRKHNSQLFVHRMHISYLFVHRKLINYLFVHFLFVLLVTKLLLIPFPLIFTFIRLWLVFIKSTGTNGVEVWIGRGMMTIRNHKWEILQGKRGQNIGAIEMFSGWHQTFAGEHVCMFVFQIGCLREAEFKWWNFCVMTSSPFRVSRLIFTRNKDYVIQIPFFFEM